jgi:hypothetical protein
MSADEILDIYQPYCQFLLSMAAVIRIKEKRQGSFAALPHQIHFLNFLGNQPYPISDNLPLEIGATVADVRSLCPSEIERNIVFPAGADGSVQ